MNTRGGIPSVKSHKMTTPTILAVLASTFSEWFLIFMLLLNAVFSYLVMKFASYSQLRAPCLLCSRLDHIFGIEKPGYYLDLICCRHKFKMSSLVLCHLHDRLINVHGMCESCLFSFTTVNKSNAETYRLLVGKLGAKSHLFQDYDDPLAHNFCENSPAARNCSCCGAELIFRGYAQKLFQTKQIECESASSLPLSRRNNEDVKTETSQPVSECHSVKTNAHALSRIEYSKVEIISDSESETQLVDVDRTTALIREIECLSKDVVAEPVPSEPIVTVIDDSPSNKHMHAELSLLDSEMQLKANVLRPVSALSDLLSFDEAFPSSDAPGAPFDLSASTFDATEAEKTGKEIKADAETTMEGRDSNSTTEAQTDKSDSNMQMLSSLDLRDAYKLAIGSRGRQLSGKLLEQRSFKESSRLSDDLKILFSQLSGGRGVEMTLNDISPRISTNADEFRTSEPSSSVGMQILQRRISLERNESALSLDGSIVSEIEGESVVDRLRRQVEHDRKLMGALYKELDEERNASAIAANQAMAMITRLQEEKSALHMEALQCLRMMEQQAEYDAEALQTANDLLAEKDKEIQDLEAELEIYRKKSGDRHMPERTPDPNLELMSGETRLKTSSSSHADHNGCGSVKEHNIYRNTDEATNLKDMEANSQSSVLELEEERLYIHRSLEKLKEKLHLFSRSDAYLDLANDDFSADERVRASNLYKHYCMWISQDHSETERKLLPKDYSIYDNNTPDREGLASPYEAPLINSKGFGESDADARGSELDAMRNEFFVLSGRLEALEADHCFLQHSINSLKKGDEGLKSIQEISCYLRELNLIEIRRRQQFLS